MKKIYSIVCFLLLSLSLLKADNKNILITGTVLEKAGGQAVEFATVMVAEKGTDKIIAGETTDAEGKFSVRSDRTDFYVKISFIGFNPTVIEDFTIEKGRVDLGEIFLAPDSEVLEEVVVRAEKSTTEFKLDKRVFNVGKDLSSTGASALEVLNNVPSVNVNIEGEITLRGAGGVQILINGKPSVLASEEGNALGTITAEMIEKIEVITNPGAKYEAEGTSGIVNIIIKKDEREGINGSVSINTGTPHNHSVGLSLNRRTEKFNLFSQIGVGYRELPSDRRNINRNLLTGVAIVNEGREFRNENFYNFNLGTDYYINKYNVVTLSGSFAYEIEDQPSRNNFRIEDEAGNTTAEWFREEVTEATNPKYQYELQYKKSFKDDKEHNLLFSAVGNFFGKDLSSTFTNTNVTGDEAQPDQETRTNFNESRTTLKLDYSKPIGEKFTLETGAQYFLNDVSNDFAVIDLVDGQRVPNEDFTNIFEYQQNVLGVYATGAYEADKWGLKLGLRVENTDLDTRLVNTDEVNDQNFTNLFPSAHTSYKFSEKFSAQAGYSRRIFRPRLWSLNPFFNVRNNFSIRTGNPDLLPEFTDSYEVGTIHTFNKVSFNFNIYHRYTTAVIERVVTFKDNVSTTFPVNLGTRRTTGIEVNGKYSPLKSLSFNGDFNFNYFSREGVFEERDFSFNAERYSGKLITKVKLPGKLDFEATSRYESRFETVQGVVSDNLYFDLGLRKKILKGKGVLNFSIRDIFASRIRESVTIQPEFTLYNFSQRGRFITLGFSYGFGKGEAMEYTGRRR